MSRNITVKGKNRRRDRRHSSDLPAEFDGRSVSLVDLSIAGFGAAVDATSVEPADFAIGKVAVLAITLKDGRRMRLDVIIERGVAPDGTFGGRFVSLSDENYRLIEALLMGREHRV